jgi:TRAP-type C4-dicarboxylate transport system permease small subunit
MQFVERVLGRVVDAVTVLGAVAIFLMMAHITLDVAGRFLFNAPPPGTLVFVANYYMVIVAFLSMAFAERRNQHISVEILTERMALGVQHKLGFGTTLLSAGMFGLLAWRGFGEAGTKFADGSILIEQGVAIPVWPSYFLLPVGAGLMCAVLVFKLLRFVRGGPDAATTVRF